MLKILKDRAFWIGANFTLFIFIVISFFVGEGDWKFTMIWGTISILSIGYDAMKRKEEKEY